MFLPYHNTAELQKGKGETTARRSRNQRAKGSIETTETPRRRGKVIFSRRDEVEGL